MAATAITLRIIAPDGILDSDVNMQAFHATDGAAIVNDGRTRIRVKNAGAGAHTITAVTPKILPGGLAVADKTFVIAAGKVATLPLLDPQFFNDPATGKVTLTASGTQTECSATAERETL